MPIPIWEKMEHPQPSNCDQDVELTVLLSSELLKAVQDYAAEYRITPHQMIERAIAKFLDLEGDLLSDCSQTESIAELKNKMTILQAKLDGLEQAPSPS